MSCSRPIRTSTPSPAPPERWDLPERGPVGMICLIIAEAAIFTDLRGRLPLLPRQVGDGPAAEGRPRAADLSDVCLLSSSSHDRARRARRCGGGMPGSSAPGGPPRSLLAAIFLGGTGLEWKRLIFEKGLTIRTNLFGTTYYSLVGLHAFHVTVGTLFLLRRARAGAGRQGRARARAARDVLGLLALRGRGVGRRVHRRLRHRALSMRRDGSTTSCAAGRRASICPRRRRGRSSWRSASTLLFAGLVTHVSVSVAGALCPSPAPSAGSARSCPTSSTRRCRSSRSRTSSRPARARAWRGSTSATGPHRARLPIEIHPVSAGVKGGLAGGVAMARARACSTGVVKAGQRLVPDQPPRRGALRELAALSLEEPAGVSRRRARAGASSSICSPRPWSGCSTASCSRCSRGSPILLGGLVAPLLWTGLLHACSGHQPGPGRADRLAVVRRLADRLSASSRGWS